jgi:hypothetical protein
LSNESGDIDTALFFLRNPRFDSRWEKKGREYHARRERGLPPLMLDMTLIAEAQHSAKVSF